MVVERTSVLVVGGSLVGLSAANFLSKFKIPMIVIEKHVGSAVHPRAIGYTPRTIEAFATVGNLVEKIPMSPPNFRLRRISVESLAGKWHHESDWTPKNKSHQEVQKEPPKYSPYHGIAIAQDHLEPILRDSALKLGTDLRQGTELLKFEQDDKKVTAFVKERSNGREYTIEADYMIAADGHKSSIREALSIPRKGRGHIRTLRSVLFRAPLDQYLESGFSQFEIDQPGLKGAFLTTYRDGRWVLMFDDDREKDSVELSSLVQRAIGKETDVEIITTGRWELSALIAEYFSSGRVFLAGDAAHVLPPTRGGFGANTGIEDVHNLAWKLRAVLSGQSSPTLLASYSEERQPVAWLRHQQTFARPDYAKWAGGETDGQMIPILDDIALELGNRYRSSAVLLSKEEEKEYDGPNLPAARRPDEWQGLPGTRAPYVAISYPNSGPQDAPGSSLDLFGSHWVLLSADDRWKEAAARASAAVGVPLKVEIDGQTVHFPSSDSLQKVFGLSPQGAVLVRPDGYIAWRSKVFDDRNFLAAFAKVTSAMIWNK